MRLFRPLVVAALATVSFLSVARIAGAQSSADKALAESLFQDAKRLMKAGKNEEACPKLAESNRLVPKLGTLLNLATCHAEVGKTASAWAEFNQAEGQANGAHQADRARYAHDQAAELEKRLSRMVLEIDAPDEGTVIKLDGEVVSGHAALNTPLTVDPGIHQLSVSAPGKKTFNTTARVDPGPATVRVKLPPLESDAPVAPAAPAPPASPAPSPAAGRGRGPQWIAGVVVAATGGAALIVGSVFGARTFALESDSNGYCKGIMCKQPGVDDRQSARTSATISTAMFVAGGVAVAGGLVLIFTAPSPAKADGRGGGGARAATGLWVAPAIGGGEGGLVLGGTW